MTKDRGKPLAADMHENSASSIPRILIVEDEAHMAGMLKRTIERFGYLPTGHASTGQTAIEMALDDPPDLILMDIVLDGPIDGISAAEIIAQQIDVPVLFITGHADEDKLERIKPLNPFGYVIKPFDIRELAAAMDLALARADAERLRRKAEEELRSHRRELERSVTERTAELESANQRLLEEISERARAEQAVKESEENLRTVVESASGFAVYQLEYDPSSPYLARAVFTSPSSQDIVGLSDVARFPEIFTMAHPDDVGELIEANVRAWETGGILNQTFRLFHPIKKEWRWVQSIATGVLDSEGRVTRCNGIIIDVTEQKQAAAELEKVGHELRNLSAHLQSVREEERMSIARDLHDDLGQNLSALKIDLSLLKTNMSDDQADLRERIDSMNDLIDSTISSVKRIISDLRPSVLDELGLVPALEWMLEQFSDHFGLECRLIVGDDEMQLDQELCTALFRILQEALTNIVRHALATRVEVTLDRDPEHIQLTIRDDGTGLKEEQKSKPGSFGLLGIRERAHFLGGHVLMRGIEGRGTEISVRIPQPGGR
ncbi:MAG: response regulator [Proteobacteria bacterium]|nr:response regulator [Pseudomonadota bacterium]